MSPPVRYSIVPKNPAAHLFEVALEIEDAQPAGERFFLPTWIPGSYLVREFARNIVELRASAGTVTKDAKNAFTVVGASGKLELRYTVYAWDLSVRAAHLDQTHAFFNGPSVFLASKSRAARRCEVRIEAPQDPACRGWRVATTLPQKDVRAPGFGTYEAADYDELIDHPVEMGTYDLIEFDVFGTPHAMAITGRHRADKDRLKRDLKRVCEQHVELFGKPAPMERYLFLTTVLGEGYGGLEHRSSTALICKRDDLPLPGRPDVSDGYRNFLGLASHEYFHLWNVKRIKPAAFAPYDLERENYTRLLWAFEGTTSYYDDLALVRSGLLTLESWLDLVARTITRVVRGKGRLKQSLADSSFDAWIKFYRPDENTSNAVVSYYTKGAIAALALDLTIREATNDAKSLDDVMRALWERFGKTGVGVPENGVEQLAAEIAGVDLRAFFDHAVRGTGDIDVAPLLARYGIELHLRPAESDADAGGKPGTKKADELAQKGTLGVTIGGSGDDALVAAVVEGGAGQEGGLSAGDVIVAVEGLRATRGNVQRLVAERAPGTKVRLHEFRRDELLELEVAPRAPEADTAFFVVKADAPADVVERRVQWLGEPGRGKKAAATEE
jgi:predicted metalloprotease with PDZ domain